MTTDELNLAIRDSLLMEAAKTYNELDYICRNIEARHKVEGIAPMDLSAYELVKAQHIKRVVRVLVA